MEQVTIAIQEQLSAWTPVLATIVLALPGAGLGALVSALITEGFKAGYQRKLEDVRGEHLREIERLKSELARDLAKDTEALKSQLAIASFEHQTRFSRLHERRVNVIAELYKRLANAEVAFARFMNPIRWGNAEEIAKQEEEDKQEAARDGNDFNEYFRENRVWLDEELCTIIDSLALTFREAWFDYTNKERARIPSDTWDKAWRKVTEEAPKIRGEIETVMRRMLMGVAPTD